MLIRWSKKDENHLHSLWVLAFEKLTRRSSKP